MASAVCPGVMRTCGARLDADERERGDLPVHVPLIAPKRCTRNVSSGQSFAQEQYANISPAFVDLVDLAVECRLQKDTSVRIALRRVTSQW